MSGLVPFNRTKLTVKPSNFNDFYNVIDDFFNDSWLPNRSLINDTFKVDVQETESGYLIEADLPGVKKEEIELDFNEGKLSIHIQREENKNEETKNYIHRERKVSSMKRAIYLQNAKPDGIKAKLEDGILKLTVDKVNKDEVRQKIEIE